MSKITNEDVLLFYADAFEDEEDHPITKSYLSALKQQELNESAEAPGKYLHGDYNGVMRVFKEGVSVDGKKKGLTDDENFYIWLKNHELFAWLMEYTFKVHDIFLQTTDYYQAKLQKWHLYISWCAYHDSGIRGKGPSPRAAASQFKCKELLLWMYEAAVLKTGAPDLDAVRKAIEDGTMDGTKVWEAVSGGSVDALRNKIYDIIEKNLSAKG